MIIINHTLNFSPLRTSSLSQSKWIGKQIRPGWGRGKEGGVWLRNWSEDHRKS